VERTKTGSKIRFIRWVKLNGFQGVKIRNIIEALRRPTPRVPASKGRLTIYALTRKIC